MSQALNMEDAVAFWSCMAIVNVWFAADRPALGAIWLCMAVAILFLMRREK